MKTNPFYSSALPVGLLVFLIFLSFLLLGNWKAFAQEDVPSSPLMTEIESPSQNAPSESQIDATLAVTTVIYLPMLGNLSATTKSAVLARSPTGREMGLLGGLLGLGLLIGVGLVFWSEPKERESVDTDDRG